ncbi:YfjP family GTPase, partial [Streptomyces sp. RM1]
MTAVTDQEHIEHMEHVEHTGSSSHSGAGDGLVRQDTGHARARAIDLGKQAEGDGSPGTRPASEQGADHGSVGGGEKAEKREDPECGENVEQGEKAEKQKEKVEKPEAGVEGGGGSGDAAGGSPAAGGSDAGEAGGAGDKGEAADARRASGFGSRSGSRSGSGSPSGAGSSPRSGSGSGSGSGSAPVTSATSATPAPSSAPSGSEPSAPADSTGAWDDGLIARRVTDAAALAAGRATALEPAPSRGPGGGVPPVPLAYEGPLRSRLDALRELVGLSRARLDGQTLAEAGRVLDEAAARRKLSGRHTVVAIAGATGSGKSQLFNTLAGVAISETGVRRPTTASPIACSWSDGAAGLIDRLGIPGRLRRRPLHTPDGEKQLRGLVLIDLPDHDSAAVQHREQVERILKLVDAVIWVVDPEKYADAVLHERYLRPMAGHAEVMFIVLNQVDRLPGEAADMVLDDLRRLLDEDGVALGEHGEPGATVLALSALTGEGVGELREALGEFVTERGAAARRVAADVDAAAAELRPVYAAGRRVGLSE